MFLKASRCLFIILMLAGMILSACGLLTYPFKYVWLLFTSASIAITIYCIWANKADMRSLIPKLVLLSGTLCVTLTLMVFLLLHPKRSYEYISPYGENIVIVEYDMRSTPSLYRKHNRLFQSKIPLDSIPGFMEQVTFDVIWHSDDRLKLDLGLYKGKYEKFEVDLSTGESQYFRVDCEDITSMDEW